MLSAAIAQIPLGPEYNHFPWSDATLYPDLRADMVIKHMTLDEKITLLHWQGMPFFSRGPTGLPLLPGEIQKAR